MKKSKIVLVLIAVALIAIVCCLFRETVATEILKEVSPQAATSAPTTEPVAVATATPTHEVIAATSAPTHGVTAATAAPIHEVTEPVAVATAAPTHGVTAATAVPTHEVTEPAWYSCFVRETAKELYALTFGHTVPKNKGEVAVFSWAITREELNKLSQNDWEELSQYVNDWEAYELPQNSEGVLTVLREQDPAGWYSKGAASAAPSDAVTADGYLRIWRNAVSADERAIKEADFEFRPMVVVLREPNDAGQQVFLVVDGEQASGYTVTRSAEAEMVLGASFPNEGYVFVGNPGHAADTNNKPVHAVDSNNKPVHAVDSNNKPPVHAADSNVSEEASGNNDPVHADDGASNSDGHGVAVGAPSF